MEGFGVHTFRLVDERGTSRFVKFHWKPALGVHSVLWDEALKISGKDPDFQRRDLWEAIDSGAFPEWELGLQIIEEKDEHTFEFDLLDPTKIVPEELVPVKRVGRLVLDRNPDNFFAETEQVAFHPGHLVSGIDFTNDPLLQGGCSPTPIPSSFAWAGPTSTRSRSIGRWRPCTTTSATGTCARRSTSAQSSYHPNSLGGGCPMQAGRRLVASSATRRHRRGEARARGEKFFDHFSQATLFWNSQSAAEQGHIVQAFRFELEVSPSNPRANAGHARPGRQGSGRARLGRPRDARAGARQRPPEPERARRSRPEGLSAPAVQAADRSVAGAEHGRHRQGHSQDAQGRHSRRRRRGCRCSRRHAAPLEGGRRPVEGRRAEARGLDRRARAVDAHRREPAHRGLRPVRCGVCPRRRQERRSARGRGLRGPVHQGGLQALQSHRGERRGNRTAGGGRHHGGVPRARRVVAPGEARAHGSPTTKPSSWGPTLRSNRSRRASSGQLPGIGTGAARRRPNECRPESRPPSTARSHGDLAGKEHQMDRDNVVVIPPGR